MDPQELIQKLDQELPLPFEKLPLKELEKSTQLAKQAYSLDEEGEPDWTSPGVNPFAKMVGSS